MDIPAATGAWIALGVVLAVLLFAAAGLLLRRRASPPPATTPPPGRHDDLPGFLEHPPGTAGAPPVTGGGWTALSAPAPPRGPAAPAEPPRSPRRARSRVVPATAVAVLVLLGAIVAALTFPDGGDGRGSAHERDPGRDRTARPDRSDRPPADAVAVAVAEARLSFGGVVLEPHAVGVTATYPELRLTADGDRLRADLELPTWNCLAGEAPDDPVAAGCRRTVPETADLAEPDLEVTATGDGLRIRGRFATSTRPNGSDPAPTGRSYELDVTVDAGQRPGRDWLPADGVLRLGDDRTASTGTDLAARVNVLRYRER